MCDFIIGIVLLAAGGYVGYQIGRAVGREEAMSGRRFGCRSG